MVDQEELISNLNEEIEVQLTMLKVFAACIDVKILPEVNSDCHKHLKWIIVNSSKNSNT